MKHIVQITMEFVSSDKDPAMSKTQQQQISGTLAFVFGTSGVKETYAAVAKKCGATLVKFSAQPLGVVGVDVSPMGEDGTKGDA